MNEGYSERARNQPQFSLRTLLLIAVGTSVYLAFGLFVSQHLGRLLDIVADAAGIFAFGCWALLLASFCMMVVNITLGRQGFFWPMIVLLTSLAYAVANVILFIATLSVDRSAIFDHTYLITTVLLGPAIMLVAIVVFAGFFRRIGWLSLLGFIMWVEGVAFAHLWIIAAASASI